MAAELRRESRSNTMLACGISGRPSFGPSICMLSGIRLRGWAVIAKPAPTTAKMADRLGLV